MKIAMTALSTLFLGMAAAHAQPPEIKVSDSAKVYTDAQGMTLYTFDKDSDGKSACDGDWAVKGPPLKADAGAAADGDFTLVQRTDGSMMWALAGKPLYTYVEDKKAGDMTGDGVGGVWHIAKSE